MLLLQLHGNAARSIKTARCLINFHLQIFVRSEIFFFRSLKNVSQSVPSSIVLHSWIPSYTEKLLIRFC